MLCRWVMTVARLWDHVAKSRLQAKRLANVTCDGAIQLSRACNQHGTLLASRSRIRILVKWQAFAKQAAVCLDIGIGNARYVVDENC